MSNIILLIIVMCGLSSLFILTWFRTNKFKNILYANTKNYNGLCGIVSYKVNEIYLNTKYLTGWFVPVDKDGWKIEGGKEIFKSIAFEKNQEEQYVKFQEVSGWFVPVDEKGYRIKGSKEFFGVIKYIVENKRSEVVSILEDVYCDKKECVFVKED